MRLWRIIRNTFSVEKMRYTEETGTVIYRSKRTHGKNKRNFEVYTALEFIAAITQHIPEKSFQMLRYYGWYSNKSRGIRKKKGIHRMGGEPVTEPEKDVEIIDVSDYQPRRIPSKTWRECIKKIYEVDPLICPRCGGEMKIISFITDPPVIRHILECLELWAQKSSRGPPDSNDVLNDDLVYEPFDDLSACNAQAGGWPCYDEPYIAVN